MEELLRPAEPCRADETDCRLGAQNGVALTIKQGRRDTCHGPMAPMKLPALPRTG